MSNSEIVTNGISIASVKVKTSMKAIFLQVLSFSGAISFHYNPTKQVFENWKAQRIVSILWNILNLAICFYLLEQDVALVNGMMALLVAVDKRFWLSLVVVNFIEKLILSGKYIKALNELRYHDVDEDLKEKFEKCKNLIFSGFVLIYVSMGFLYFIWDHSFLLTFLRQVLLAHMFNSLFGIPLLEILLLFRLQLHFRLLQKNLQPNVYETFEKYHKLMKTCETFVEILQISKVVYVVMAIFWYSLYTFYIYCLVFYEITIEIGIPVIILWQFVFSVLFISCSSWGDVSSEVS